KPIPRGPPSSFTQLVHTVRNSISFSFPCASAAHHDCRKRFLRISDKVASLRGTVGDEAGTMRPELDAGAIERAVKDLVAAEPSNLGVEVTLPVAYPGGDLITVVVERKEASMLVHDAGFAAMRLANGGVTLSRSVVTRLQEYAKRFNCGFSDGRVSTECDLGKVGICAALVANASRSVADYVLEIRRHAESDFRRTISDNLREIMGRRLRENEEIRGVSGRRYRVPITVLDKNEAVPTRAVSERIESVGGFPNRLISRTPSKSLLQAQSLSAQNRRTDRRGPHARPRNLRRNLQALAMYKLLQILWL